MTWSDTFGAFANTTHTFADSVGWAYVAGGVTENGGGPRVNDTALVDSVFTTFDNALRTAAFQEQVPIELLVAAVATFAAEPVGVEAAGSYERFLPGFVGEEETPELVYGGCAGLRLDKAREAIPGVSLPTLTSDPSIAILAAARHISAAISQTRFQVPMVGSAYNSGTVLYDATSRWRMSGQDQTDRFVAWFNTTIRTLQINPARAGIAPNFYGLLATIKPPAPVNAPVAANTWSLRRPESVALMEDGLMTVCPSNPELSTIWSLDTTTTEQIKSVAQDAANPLLGLPMGSPVFAYPDRGGTMRVMNTVEVIALYRAMRDFVSAVIYYDTGRAESLPGQPALLA